MDKFERLSLGLSFTSHLLDVPTPDSLCTGFCNIVHRIIVLSLFEIAMLTRMLPPICREVDRHVQHIQTSLCTESEKRVSDGQRGQNIRGALHQVER